MIVIDASAMVEALIGRDADAELLHLIGGDLAAPHLLDVEVLSVLRGLVLADKLGADVADEARRDFNDLTIARYEAAPLADRIWAWRHRLTSYDAWYATLADALGATLCTCDVRLGRAVSGLPVRVFARTH